MRKRLSFGKDHQRTLLYEPGGLKFGRERLHEGIFDPGENLSEWSIISGGTENEKKTGLIYQTTGRSPSYI